MADLVLGAALGTAFTLLYDAVDEATVGQFKKFKPLQCYSYHCNDFNATPTTATTQLVPSSNTLTASVGFSNGANFVSSPASSVGFIANNNGDVISQQGPSQNKFGSTVQQNTGYSQYNNGRSNAGNFNGSNEYSENNNGGYSKLQPKAAGVQRIESDDLRQLHTHTMKVTKSELIAPEMLLKSVQKSSKHVVVAASDNKRSENSNDTGSVDLLISKLNSIALSPNFENASKEGDSAVNQSKASLESYVDQEN